MLEFLETFPAPVMEHCSFYVFSLLLILYICFLIWHARWQRLHELVYKNMFQAEKSYGPGNGPLKFRSVVDRVYTKLPLLLSLFMSEERLKKEVQRLYDNLKYNGGKKC